MVSRRSRRARKCGKALGDFISRQLGELRAFADYLNDEPRPYGGRPGLDDAETDTHIREVTQGLYRAWETAREVAIAGAGRAVLPPTALPLLRALAEGTPVTYRFGVKGQLEGRDAWAMTHLDPTQAHLRVPSTRPDLYLELASPSVSLAGFIHVLAYVQSPHRERLRRCQQCRRWFVDETRNASARRCSRECTIKWSNSQRTKKGTRR
jgi:predicted RNA-binding Zn ribbon-like protein